MIHTVLTWRTFTKLWSLKIEKECILDHPRCYRFFSVVIMILIIVLLFFLVLLYCMYVISLLYRKTNRLAQVQIQTHTRTHARAYTHARTRTHQTHTHSHTIPRTHTHDRMQVRFFWHFCTFASTDRHPYKLIVKTNRKEKTV